MTYDLYFHNDFDGHATAAVMLAFFESRGDRIGHFVPVDHDLQSQWLRDGFFKEHHLFAGKRNAPVVVDFPYHPGTAFWFDHHPTAFKKESWKKSFKEDLRHAYRPGYASCCHMAVAMLKRNFGWRAPDHFKELVVWLDIIDGSRYESPRQTILIKEPALIIDAYLETQERNARKSEWLIKLLARKSFADIAKIPRIAAAAARARKSAIRHLAFYRKHIAVRGDATAIDLARDSEKFLRYAPYDLFPKIRYAVRIRRKGPVYSVGVGANPWLRRKGGVHLGKLVKKYGGGGHKDAAAVEFETRAEAMRAVEEMIKVLNEKRNGEKK
jgi:hypothetical protein